MPDQFTVGEVVRLKSGGLPMTLIRVTPTGLHCNWFDERNELQQAIFPPEALRKEGEGEQVDAE